MPYIPTIDGRKQKTVMHGDQGFFERGNYLTKFLRCEIIFSHGYYLAPNEPIILKFVSRRPLVKIDFIINSNFIIFEY